LTQEDRREVASWNGEAIATSASFGVTTALPDKVDSPIRIARADAPLYRAESVGRNCVRVATDPVPVS
jgi:GGDEF domain-containing protein